MMKHPRRNFTIEQNSSIVEAEQGIVPLNQSEFVRQIQEEARTEIEKESQRREQERKEEINDKRIKAEAYLQEVTYLNRKKTKVELEEDRERTERLIAERTIEKMKEYRQEKMLEEGKLIHVNDYHKRSTFLVQEPLSPEVKSKAIETSAKLHAFVETLMEREEIPLEVAKLTLQNLLKGINYKIKLREGEIERSILNKSFSKQKEVEQKEIEAIRRQIPEKALIIITKKESKQKTKVG